MRCTRCDRPAVPQTVGLSAEGALIFGWCLPCLQQVECLEVEIAEPTMAGRRGRGSKGVRLDLRDSSTRRLRRCRRAKKYRARLRRSRHVSVENRVQIIGAIGLLLVLWGLSLGLVGLSLLWRRPLIPASPPSQLGNGTPALLIGGGCSTILAGLFLWGLTAGRRWIQARETLRMAQGLGIAATVAVLVVGILLHSPRRDAFIVFLGGVAVSVTIGARWLETRQGRGSRLRRSTEVL